MKKKTDPNTCRSEDEARRRAAAEKYRPARIRVLLVAEAPPAAKDRYFYFEDVASHDWLFLEVAQGLLDQRPTPRSQRPKPGEKAAILDKLREMGVFLIDLKPDPVDGTSLKLYVPELVVRCRRLKPERIILIKATVFDAAYDALHAAGLPVVNQRVYFPSTGRQAEFREQFAKALDLDRTGLR